MPVEANAVRTSEAVKEVFLLNCWITCDLVVWRFFDDLNIVRVESQVHAVRGCGQLLKVISLLVGMEKTCDNRFGGGILSG